MKKIIFIFLLLHITLFSTGQEKCGTQTYMEKKLKLEPQYALERQKVNTQTRKWLEDNYQDYKQTIISIPIVVHIVWRTNEQNITDAQIQSQIDVLNNDYRRTNIDLINTPIVWQQIAADCEIEFCLASIDPNGQPTNGIQRIQTSHAEFGMNSDIHTSSAGGSDDWPNDDYLNIWVCDLQSGLLGYASKPSFWISDGDGVVIDYENFGNTNNLQPPYNKGRTATHEIGHWLNLDHLWGASGNCGDDQINDTPQQEEANYSCPGFPANANACNTTNSHGDMFMNYMDYTNDACMNLFTIDQKARMISAINQYRPNMLNHNLCSQNVGFNNIKSDKKLLKIIDFLGREIKDIIINTPVLYIYDNGSVEKKIVIH